MHPVVIVFCQWRYLLLLAALLLLLVIQPIVSGFGAAEWLFDALLVVVMVTMLLALAQEKAWRVIALFLCIPAAALSIGSYFLTSTAQEASLTAGHAIGALFLILVTGRIIQSIFESQALSLDSIFGAICGYMLLGVAWGLTYAMIHAANPESFQFHNSFREHVEQGNSNNHVFIYYSFVTLTTVGYGDITPVSTPARTLAWVEAMTGQLYLAVLIAGLISALVASKKN
jgi:hypothetical protein